MNVGIIGILNTASRCVKLESTMTKKVLIIEDDAAIAQGLAFNLRMEGFEPWIAPDGKTGRELFYEEKPDLILLDLMLPDASGIDLCRALRAECETPILMLTARAEEQDKVRGLSAGADDYITKPFSIMEVLARIRAALRRAAMRQPEADCIHAGPLVLDRGARTVTMSGTPLDLRRREFDLLVLLATQPGKVQTRADLLDAVWEEMEYVDPGTLDVHIRRLREKIEEDPGNPRHILTVRGVGYRFQA